MPRPCISRLIRRTFIAPCSAAAVYAISAYEHSNGLEQPESSYNTRSAAKTLRHRRKQKCKCCRATRAGTWIEGRKPGLKLARFPAGRVRVTEWGDRKGPRIRRSDASVERRWILTTSQKFLRGATWRNLPDRVDKRAESSKDREQPEMGRFQAVLVYVVSLAVLLWTAWLLVDILLGVAF